MGEAIVDDRGSDRLARVLQLLRMRSVFYCHAEFTEPFSAQMPAIADSVSFHVIATGSCYLKVPGSQIVELQAGDMALVPHGRGHALLSRPEAGPGPRVDLLPQKYISDSYSYLRYGGSGQATSMICGVVSFDSPAARELIGSLPPVLLVGKDSTSAASAVRDTLRLMARELAQPQLGAEAVVTRLADIIVVQAIRGWLATSSERASGWLQALTDKSIGRVLEAIHDCPGDDWTVERMARLASMSRSAFAGRFTELVGQAPISYLTRWRMNVAQSRLREERITIAALSAELGYQSEAAFSRAFVRVTGSTPGSVRKQR